MALKVSEVIDTILPTFTDTREKQSFYKPFLEQLGFKGS